MMKYTLDLPEEPEGPVWDDDGDRYDRRDDGMWYPSYGSNIGMTRRRLLAFSDGLTDENDDYPRPGELSAVTTIDNIHYIVTPLHGEPNQLLVVLPPEESGYIFSTDIVQFCTPLVAVPQQFADLDGNAKDWLYNNQEFQPKAAKELLANYGTED